jgi:polyvinyl alcohol dehydrogenase (cytochrome)
MFTPGFKSTRSLPRLRWSRQLLAMAASLPIAAAAASAAEGVDGARVYDGACAQCHGGAVKKAPEKTMLQLMSARVILSALESGVMAAQTPVRALTREERVAVAEYLSGQSLADGPASVAPACSDPTVKPGAVRLGAWGVDGSNRRYFPPALAGLDADDLPRLELKWAVRFPDAIRARSQPAIAHDTLYVGSQSSGVVALDARSGCLRWQYQTVAEVRTAVVADPEAPIVYFGDLVGYVYALDARSGELLWRDRPDDHPSLTITAAPTLHEGSLYVSLSSLEVTAAADPGYACCTFRGAVVRYDAQTGERRWISHTIPEPAVEAGKNSAGTPILAPSGAPVWNTPSIDTARGRLYVGTGENYSSPADGHSDAVIAMDLDSGAIAWVRQVTEGDAWNIACELENDANCPSEDGPDYDFGAATIIAHTAEGRDVVLAGQKSGRVHALDPDDDGAVIWSRKLGRGGIQGGVHFGMAATDDALYVPMSDFDGGARWPGEPFPGMYRVDIATGDVDWYHRHDAALCEGRDHCQPGISAPPSAIDGAVLAGGMDGVLRAYAADSGELLWQYDTLHSYHALGGVEGRGGSFGGGSGPVLVDGMLYITSGYGIYEHMPGNVLLAFGLPESPAATAGD